MCANKLQLVLNQVLLSIVILVWESERILNILEGMLHFVQHVFHNIR